MNGKKLLAGIVTIIFGLSVAGLFSANADTERATTDSTYTTADIQTCKISCWKEKHQTSAEKTMI